MTNLSNINKISTSTKSEHTKGILSYILTDIEDFILVGASEDLFLVWQEAIALVNPDKVSATLTNVNK